MIPYHELVYKGNPKNIVISLTIKLELTRVITETINILNISKKKIKIKNKYFSLINFLNVINFCLLG